MKPTGKVSKQVRGASSWKFLILPTEGRKTMKTKLLTGLIIANIVAFVVMGNGTAAKAQQGIELGDGVVVTATVVAIDRVDRNISLLGPDGNVVTVEVTHAARNFDQIRVGDQVKVEYYEAVAIYIGKHGEKPEAEAGLVAATPAKGQRPAAVVVEAVDVSAKVRAVDKEKRSVTLELPDGRMVTTRVDKSIKAFDTLMKGDSVHARFTEAIAVSVEKP
jgi:hypothetical protein